MCGEKPDTESRMLGVLLTQSSGRWDMVVFSGTGHMGTSGGDGNAARGVWVSWVDVRRNPRPVPTLQILHKLHLL